MRVLIFGDSITQGFWDKQGGWAERLRNYYAAKEIQDQKGSEPTIFNLGISGDNTADIIARFENETKARWSKNEELALVFSIGTNDSYIRNGAERSSPDKYNDELIELIEKARRFTDKVMFVGLPSCDDEKTNPVGWDDGLIFQSHRIKLFEDVARAFCREQNIPHVQIYETFMDKKEMGIELFQDGLHPNDLGHQLMYELVKPELDKLLNT